MRRLAALTAVLFLAACTNEIDQSTRPSSVIGTYQLRSYGGRSLPALISSDAATGVTEVVGGQLVLRADRTYVESLDYRFTKGSVVQTASFGSSGSWSLHRDIGSVLFTDSVNLYQFTGVAAGRTVTLELSDGTTVIFQQ